MSDLSSARHLRTRERPVPSDKHDVAAAQAAVDAGVSVVSIRLPALLEWTKDMNWPVAQVLAPLLVSAGALLAEPARAVLAGEDRMWQYYLLNWIIARSPDLLQALESDIRALLARLGDDAESADIRWSAVPLLTGIDVGRRLALVEAGASDEHGSRAGAVS